MPQHPLQLDNFRVADVAPNFVEGEMCPESPLPLASIVRSQAVSDSSFGAPRHPDVDNIVLVQSRPLLQERIYSTNIGRYIRDFGPGEKLGTSSYQPKSTLSHPSPLSLRRSTETAALGSVPQRFAVAAGIGAAEACARFEINHDAFGLAPIPAGCDLVSHVLQQLHSIG